ncbi:MAG: hypothetical protein HZC17_04905 [Candidatus Omnitrophica bacterium]|nr:hypothetical protein [Candidatus Omnitrophota bacterium]
MKSQMKLGIITLLALLLPVGAVSFAAETVAVGNKTCPISGEQIKKPYEVEYNGKSVSLCCKMCLKDFNKDPEAAIEKASKDTGNEN